MKVGNIYPVMFKSSNTDIKMDKNTNEYPQIKELNVTTPDFAVKTPQKYQHLGITDLSNGLKAHSYKLANGHRITIIPMEGSPAVVKNYVNVGSMNETDDIKGISHFLEHMAFNGTNGENGYIKLNVGDSFKKIDSLGGWTNASTNYALTDYVNSTPLLDNKDLEEQIKIIAGMTEDLALTPEMIEKEKGPVCSEINMILDNPQTILLDQTVRTLFDIKSSADELVGGSTQHIKNLTREKVKAYYDKYYTPDNMNLVITGEVDPQKTIELVSKNFHSTKTRTGNIYEEKLSPINKTIRKDFITDKAKSTEIMLGFAGPKNNDTKSKIIFDILVNYINSSKFGLSSELNKYNAFGDISSEKISTNPNNPQLLFYTTTCSEEHSEKVLKTLFNKFNDMKTIKNNELETIKEKLILEYDKALEYSSLVNYIVGNSIIDGEFDSISNYKNIVEKITVDDVENFIKNYINLNKVAVTVVHPETSQENIQNNYSQANNINFKSKRLPLNSDKIQETTLNNNYKFATYKTNDENISFNINLKYDYPKDINPAVGIVLSKILSMGTIKENENAFNEYKENHNIELIASLNKQKFTIKGSSNQKNFENTVKKANDLLYTPRITQETIETSINRIKDSLNRKKDSAISLYIENEAKTNPLYTSKQEILKHIDNVTIEDVKNLHEYIINNSVGFITTNIPQKNEEFGSLSKEIFSNLKDVKPYKNTTKKVYQENLKTTVLTKEQANSQADIVQVHKFKFENSTKEIAMMEILNTLLSSSSIGLFNTLREKEHLAYSVYSNIDRIGDSAELSCHILTTTDNKNIGEISYDNVQKSINGFNRQINALKNSEYSDEDLESAKKIFKAKLLNKEGTNSKLKALKRGIESNVGINYDNEIYNLIDTISREDINNFAQKVFNTPPIYSIVASKDTLNANKDFFETL